MENIFLLCVTLLSLSPSAVNGEDICSFTQGATNLKLCRFRDEGLLPPDIWRYRTGAGCYSYSPAQWFSNRIKIVTAFQPGSEFNCTFPVGNVTSQNKMITFDYKNESYKSLIFDSFKSALYHSKWENCAKNADLCCDSVMDDKNIYPSNQYQCPATWDAWSCFNSSQSDTVSKLLCPDYTRSSEEVPCNLYSEKVCFANGTWNQATDYSTCATAPIYRKRHNFHLIILYVSVALSLPAVCIFVSYKNLRILRVNLHRNLLLACIFRNIFTILTKELVILDSLKSSSVSNNVLDENGVGCRVLAFFNSVAANAIYACMLVDGYYLHKLIVRIFNRDPNVYLLYLVTAVLSLVPTIIWAIVVAIKSNVHCWVVDTSWHQWIPDGFRIAILCLNILLLLDIIRALCRKLRKNVTAKETKSTLKATVFLLPLFGVPFILTANRNIVDTSSCSAGDIYYYISYSIQALQSVMVAILFCYWNKEVHTQIKRTYGTVKIVLNERFGLNFKQTNKRRDTAATYVQNTLPLAPADPRDSKIRAKVNNWLSENPIGEDSQQQETDLNHFNEISKYIDDSVDNSTTLDNDDLYNSRANNIEIDKMNLNVKFSKD